MKTRATIDKNATARTGRAAYAAEPAQATAEEQAVSRSVDAQFPAVAAFLADEQAREHTDHREPLLTPAQSTLVLDDGLGAWRTAAVETALRNIDADCTAAENAETPFLGAEVVVSDDRAQAYGRRTKVWLQYGLTIGELPPAKAREVLAAIKGFIPQLEAVVALAEEIGAGDFEGDPEIARLDQAAERRRTRAIDEARAAKAGTR
ncbi:hypothetical protein ACFY3G_14815 [Streptomyces phaeochromogenes]|uniref:hypothetical protein n=1 Tax=Streptomyces phaeochromogenes TaxID=1923 RepID=UPI00367FA761